MVRRRCAAHAAQARRLRCNCRRPQAEEVPACGAEFRTAEAQGEGRRRCRESRRRGAAGGAAHARIVAAARVVFEVAGGEEGGAVAVAHNASDGDLHARQLAEREGCRQVARRRVPGAGVSGAVEDALPRGQQRGALRAVVRPARLAAPERPTPSLHPDTSAA
jgi:hypothetical protein